MKLLIYIACMLLVAGNDTSLTELRSLYMEAGSSKTSCKKLVDICNANTSLPNNLLLGYKGSATMMMAKHVFSPVTKLSKFSEGKTILEQAVALDTSSVEVRLLRYAVQVNAPSFLGYNKSINADKAYLLKSYRNISDNALRQMMQNILIGEK
jgi:hypothetical protein